jgi:hypothetical protein
MLVINNNQEFEENYPYDKKYIKEYPCVMATEYHDAGLMGTYWDVQIAYFPESLTPQEAFLAGMNAKWVKLK